MYRDILISKTKGNICSYGKESLYFAFATVQTRSLKADKRNNFAWI